ncbi:MAG: hypothetical protein ACLR2O_12175 [Coprococcus sp.]
MVYWGVPLLRTGIKTHNLSGPADEVIPFMPQFIIIYFGCYLFWVVNYFMASMREEKVKYRFFTADFYARLVCMLCFIFYPTTNTRPVLAGTDIWTQAVRFCIQLISQSICFRPFTAWQAGSAAIAVRKNRKISNWYKAFSVLMTVLVVISTLALRQHVWQDAVAGILLAEVTWQISRRTNGWQIYRRLTEK